MSKSHDTTVSLKPIEASCSKINLSGLPQDTSSIMPSPGPEGFKNRKVELKDGYLIVTEDLPDSACTSIMGEAMDEWENVYLKHRSDIVSKDGFISTPLHVVKELATKLKTEIHIEHYILNDPTAKSKVIYRVDILFGALRGVGQCTRKQMARQLAAIDVYEKLQLQQWEQGTRPTPMPRCGLLPGWRVGSKVRSTLSKAVENKKRPVTYQVYPPAENKVGKFTAICRVGSTVTRAENDNLLLAKKLAAKEMFEEITGHEFPLETTLTGSDVIGFPQMKLLGFNPKITNLKRKWMMNNRIKDTQVVLPPTEPDDGDMEDVEEEAQIQQSKKLKLTELKETLKVTVHRQLANGKQNYRDITSTSIINDYQSQCSQSLTMVKDESHDEDDDDRLIIHVNENELLEDD